MHIGSIHIFSLRFSSNPDWRGLDFYRDSIMLFIMRTTTTTTTTTTSSMGAISPSRTPAEVCDHGAL